MLAKVLLAALDKFARSEGVDIAAARRLKKELLRWRQMLVQVYLNAADRLRRFWPPPKAKKIISQAKKL